MTDQSPSNLEIITYPHRQIAKRVFKTIEITSTNDVMLKDPEKIFHSGDVLWSLRQSKGHGRYNRVWNSPQGGLYFSILFEDIPRLGSLYPYVLLCALAIRNVLADRTGEDFFTIKWPNDVYADHHKIAGILIQSQTAYQSSRAVIGMGINLNNPMQHISNLRLPAISLYELTGNPTDPKSFLEDLLDRADAYYRDFIHQRFSHYLPELNRLLYSKDKPMILTEGKHQQIVIPREFTKDGYLRCEEDGETVILMA
ncbi:TPA: biotin--[acetyl-CoA-carboxylase] ligase [Candidatus Marinimicrobia bacterium]|nr:MAG: Biotin--acetyl-CoA-carboxylase ligase [Marinimicrobia bacterium 46_47]KUK89438.1 MAG: biotin--acetyl-CoA-carboxylase ligase [Marinimicrobia bacterium 46_43]HAE86938.1 biotin--[acetyl-CoA-carboxylase] ligase [Candidatus Neomarinimicrobiota bacterium]HBY18016.1 biotin--[acetyl-CoA-carboxylase] ligase [Candidatus Neomarinimicrobiota bacterium]